MAWSAADAERWLDELQPVGWKLGLERMHRLMSLLGMPQNRYTSIHVVGTNGKSSVTRMAAALAQAHGTPTGATFSPHLERWSERIWIRGAEVEPARFARAVERTSEGAAVVNRTLGEGEVVTQFEAAVAAAYVAMAGAKVRLAVVEAGLGGRLDATNVIPSRVTVLTSVGLDHTEWLGDDEVTIAREKLAVLRHGSVLVLGRVSPAVEAEAEARAEAMVATVLRGPEELTGIEVRARGAHQRRNFALAATAVAAALGRPLEREVVARVAAETEIPARLEQVGEDPPTFIDAAHNAEGMEALAAVLPELAAGHPVIACIAVMADKDAEAMIAALAPALAAAVTTEPPLERVAMTRPGASAHSASALAALLGASGVEAEGVAEARAAVIKAAGLARARGGIVVAAGSHYLLRAVRQAASVKAS